MSLLLGTHIDESGKSTSVEVAVDSSGRILNSSKEISRTGVAVAQAGLTVLATMLVSGYQRSFVQFVVAGQALDQFVISARATKNAPFSVLYSSTEDFENPRGLVVGTSGDLTNLQPGQTGDLTLDVRGFYELKFEASSANIAGSVVGVYGGVA